MTYYCSKTTPHFETRYIYIRYLLINCVILQQKSIEVYGRNAAGYQSYWSYWSVSVKPVAVIMKEGVSDSRPLALITICLIVSLLLHKSHPQSIQTFLTMGYDGRYK